VAKYRDELERKDFLDSFASLEDYLRELGIKVRLAVVAEDQVARVAQLTLRTNQFNLTTRRLRQQDVRELMADPRRLVLTIQSGDRFGDNGVVGAIFYRRAGEFAHIDNFLLSCRVFSRGIEQACLAALLRHARQTGVDAVFGAYRRTAKNGAVSDFYQRMGFMLTEGNDSTSSFRHDLVDIMAPPAHVDLTEQLDQAGTGRVYL
jgi:FkbH-like protein